MCTHFHSPKKEILSRLNPFTTLPKAALQDIWPGKIAAFRASDDLADWQAGAFGLMPHWAKPTHYRTTYNARTETLATKPSFRQAWKQCQLCAVPVERFFEPNYETGKAQSWQIERIDQQPFWLAGLWESFTDSFGDEVRSFTLLTLNASEHAIMNRFHGPEDEKRSVVVLPDDKVGSWLSLTSTTEAQTYFRLFDAQDFLASAA